MRMLPTHYGSPRPAKAKQVASQVAHLSPPLKGLNLSSKLTTGDPLTAPVLTNFVVEDDRITARAGFALQAALAGGRPVVTLVPWYGTAPKLAAASDNKLFLAADGSLLKDGFTTDDWSWTSFANLGQQKFTMMVNGQDGVWSWDGGAVAAEVIPVGTLSNTNPATCTVSAGNISKFQNGQAVIIAGATGGMVAANGVKVISSVGTPANTFTLTGVDLSAAGAPQTSGVTATVQGSFTKEPVTAPSADTWINVEQFNIVLSHMNRLWFADNVNLCVYYLPLQQKTGEVKKLPLNVLFKRGGSIRAMYTWTLEGGVGINDQLVIFSSNGEAVIFQGTDPDNLEAWSLVGIFRFDSPMSKHCVVNYGGDLYVLISTGLVPMSTLLKAETEQLGQIDRAVISFFLKEAIKYRDRPGWSVFINPSTQRVMCNVPQGFSNGYTQMVRHMPRPVWSQYKGVPARCFGWIDPYVYFGDDLGNVYRMHPAILNDAGNPIKVDVQMSWSLYKTPAIKHFKMIRPYTITDATLRPALDMKVDYDPTEPQNQPTEISRASAGAVWDLATWDEDYWAEGPKPLSQWTGVGRLGRVGAVRYTALLLNTEFSITGFDVLYEQGAAV